MMAIEAEVYDWRGDAETSEVAADRFEESGKPATARALARTAGGQWLQASYYAEMVSLEKALAHAQRAERCYRRGMGQPQTRAVQNRIQRLQNEIRQKSERDAVWLAGLAATPDQGGDREGGA